MNYGSGFTGGEWKCGPCNHIIPILLKLSSRVFRVMAWAGVNAYVPRCDFCFVLWNGLGLEAKSDETYNTKDL